MRVYIQVHSKTHNSFVRSLHLAEPLDSAIEMHTKGVGRGVQGGSAEPPFHFNDAHIQIFATV